MSSARKYDALKRLLDVVFSGTALACSAPFILCTGLAVKLDSPGPMFYKSRRVGKGWRKFDLYKLRTMYFDDRNASPQVTSGDDERITRIGKWLRKTKLDELPQFWNVLTGDVSLVGPRPEVERYANRLSEHYDEILTVKPGLSDRATLEFLEEESLLEGREDPESYYLEVLLPKKIEYYLDYVRNNSFWGDVSILIRTACQVLTRAIGHAFRR